MPCIMEDVCDMWRLAGRSASNEVAARLQKVAEKRFGEHVSAQAPSKAAKPLVCNRYLTSHALDT